MLLLLACTSGPEPADPPADSPVDSQPPAQVTGTFQLLNAQSGQGKSDITVTGPLDEALTDGDGRALVSLLGEQGFVVRAEGGNLLPHLLQGQAGLEDFVYISFVATQNLTDQVLSYLGGSWDPDTGIVVVGLDTPELAPATGAGASLDGDYELAFVFGPSLPEAGTTLVEGGSSIVTFVGVPPGTVSILAEPAEGSACQLFPALSGSQAQVQVEAGVVSVLTFTCE
jgi:hypothetical protein